jgi:uncharacterized protein (TIGR02246 family)
MDQEYLLSTIAALADRQAINELITHYVERIDANDPQSAARCYLEDGVGFYWGRYEGRAAIAARMAEVLAGFACTSHHVSNIQVKLDGDRATALTYFYSYHRALPDLSVIHFWGRWVDELVKLQGKWLFTRREVIGLGSHGWPAGDANHPGHPGRLRTGSRTSNSQG